MCKYICTRWACDLSNWKPTLTQLAHAVGSLQLEERERIMRFHFWNDFLASLVGRLLMRKYVSKTSGLPYNEVHFGRDERGKPYWKIEKLNNSYPMLLRRVPSELSFNVSHQGDIVILAGITRPENVQETTIDFGIGADVMKIEYSGGKPLSEFFRIMHRKFSDSEWRHITQGCERMQLKSFMRHWCLKEAYVKELGVGITVDLQKISFDVDENLCLSSDMQPVISSKLQCDGIPMNEWHFEEHLLRSEYCAAIAFRNFTPNTVEKFEFLTMEDVIVEETGDVSDQHSDLLDYCINALKKQRRDSIRN